VADVSAPGAPGAYELVVLGSTPGGIACAVRAAREGLRVLLVSYERTLGGMLAGGLGVTDTLYDGLRAPLYQAFCDGVVQHYRTTYGEGSEQHLACRVGRRTYFEPRVAEQILTDLVAAEPAVEVLRGWYVERVERQGRRLLAVHLAPFDRAGYPAPGGAPEAGPPRRRVAAGVFVDPSYEGDLAAAAGVPYRVGRESRAEHNEQHAGRIFTRHGRGHFPREAHEGHLNLGTFPVVGQEIFAGSSGEGDGLVQTYNYRICLSRDPQNRRYPERPAAYSREDYSALLEDQATNLHHPSPLRGEYLLQGVQNVRFGQGTLPNRKASWNSNGCVGAQQPYPDGDWATRRAVEQRHLVERQVMITFYNDLDMATPESWVPAVQLLGARGYFPTYDARPHAPLDGDTAARWSQLSGLDLHPGPTRAQAAQAVYAALTGPA
jgi:hypothetical protein